MMFTMDGSPFFGNHARGHPQPKTEKMTRYRMQIQSTVCLAAMQKNCDACNGDVRDDQGVNENLPARRMRQAIQKEIEYRIQARGQAHFFSRE
jgi:uncharacterized protein YijF (DUF1287 family)